MTELFDGDTVVRSSSVGVVTHNVGDSSSAVPLLLLCAFGRRNAEVLDAPGFVPYENCCAFRQYHVVLGIVS